MAVFAGVVLLVLAISAAAWTASFQRACRIDPIAVDLGPLPEGGAWSREFNLENLEKIVVGESPEDVIADSQGRLYKGLADGWIKRITVDGVVENYTHFGSAVLGLALGPGEEIYFAAPDEVSNVYAWATESVSIPEQIFQLRHYHTHYYTQDGKTGKCWKRFADGVVVAKDGTAYFSDASTKFRVKDSSLDLIEGRPNGRVLKYDPSTNSTSVLIKDMFFPNGVFLSENEEFLLIAETSRARVMRYWLKGEKEGTLDTFIDGLPGYPDNLRLSESDGNLYIGLVGTRSKSSDWALRTPSMLLRCLLVNPPVQSLVGDLRSAKLIVISPEGKLVKKYEDPTGKMISYVTGGNKIGDSVYFSGLDHNFLGRLKL